MNGKVLPVVAWSILLGGCVERVDTASSASSLLEFAAGDLDGDGLDDLVVANAAPMARVTVLLSGGGGAVTELPGPLFPAATPRDILLSDFSGDGVLDLAVGSVLADGIGPTDIYLGGGDGTFTPAATVEIPESPRVLAAGHLDGDGRLDLVIAGLDTNFLAPRRHIFVYLSRSGDAPGTIAFHQPVAYGPDSLPRDLALGDIDDDGDLDIAVATAATLQILTNDGAGAFSAATAILTGADITALALDDLDRDGLLDLVRIDASTDEAAIFFGLDGTTFAAPVSHSVGAGPTDVAVADANRDHHPDIVTTNRSASSITLLKTTHHGNISRRHDFAVGASPQELAIGHFTHDSWLDAATLNTFNITFLLVAPPSNSSPPNDL